MHCISHRVLGHIRVLACLSSLLLGSALHAQCGASWLPVTGGDPISAPRGIVNTTFNWDPDGQGPQPTNFVVGGRFAVADSTDCNVAFYDGSRWVALPPITPTGSEEVVALSNSNNRLIAVTPDRVARLEVSDTWTTIGVYGQRPFPQSFRAAVSFQNEMYVAGTFREIGEPGLAPTSAVCIARWTGTSWSPVGNGNGGLPDLFALAVFNGNLVAGGSFSLIDGVSATNLASWNGTAWSPLGDPNGPVDSLGVRTAATLNNTLLFAGGRFTSIGGRAAQGVARLPASISPWLPMNGLPPAPIGSFVRLFVRGVGLSSFECSAGSGSAVYQWNGSSWPQLFDVAPAARVMCLALAGGQVTAGLYALKLGDPARSLLALRRADGTTLHGQGIGGDVLAVADVRGQTVIAGDFQQIDGTTMNGVAIGSAGNWQPLGSGVTGGVGKVRAILTLPSGGILVGGDFTLATGGVADRIAAWNGTAWVPIGPANGPVHALASNSNGSVVYVGGAFTSIAGVNVRGLAQVRGNVWSAVDGGLDGNAGTPVVNFLGRYSEILLGVQRESLVVGGSFTTVGPTNIVANNVARFRLSNSTWETMTRLGATAPGVPVLDALATIGRSFVIAYPSNDPVWQSLDFAVGNNLVPMQTVPGSTLRVTNLQTAALVNGSAYLLYQGQFQEVIGNTTNAFSGSILRYSSQLGSFQLGTLDEPFFLTLFSGVRGSLNPEFDGDLIVGGISSTPGVTVRGGVGRLAPDCPTGVLSVGSGCGTATNPVSLVSAVSLLPWTGESLGVQTVNFAPNSLGIAVLGFLPAATPLSLILPGGGGPCNLIVDPVTTLTLAVPPGGGTVPHTVAIPASTSLAGVSVLDQVLQLTVGPAGIDGLGASQGIRFTIGVRF